jgi:hypothetical protein
VAVPVGDGAVNEHPHGTICYISPRNPEDDQVVGDPPQELSSDFGDLRRRLLAHFDSGDEADPADSDGADEN